MNYSYIGMLVLGLLISILGIPNLKGNIQSIHWYNRARVSEADAPKYGKFMGVGTIVIGLSITTTAAISLFVELLPAFILTFVGIIVGVAFMLYAQFKYNGGIF